MKKIILAFCLLLVTASAAVAQWQVPNHSIPIGKGPGNTGFRSLGPCAANGVPWWASTTSDPACMVIREALTVDRIYYVDGTNGNDANTCLAAGTSACKTLPAAIAIVANTLDGMSQTRLIKIEMAAGTYTDTVTINGQTAGGVLSGALPGGATLWINGDTTTPANVTIHTTSADGFYCDQGAKVYLSGFRYKTTTAGFGIQSQRACEVQVIGKIDFNDFATLFSGVFATYGGFIRIAADTSYSGDGFCGIAAEGDGVVESTGAYTVTFTGTRTFARGFACADAAYIRHFNSTFTGTVHGPRYDVRLSGVINTQDAGVAYFPGNADGNEESDGLYEGNTKFAAYSVWSNITGVAAEPTDNTFSAAFDAIFGSTQGQTFYRGNAGWTVLNPGTSGQLLQTKGAAANPAWTTATYPDTTTLNQLLYSSSANVIVGLATANGGMLNTSSGGVPSITATPLLGVAGTTAGTLGLSGLTSGTLTLKVAAVAGTGSILTFPGGTTDFSATSGIVQQASVGAPFTVTSVALGSLATQATNTVVGNATSGSAAPTALAVGSCSTAASALIWTTNTGFGCNTSITAAAVPASGITGTTLAANVVTSSITTVGTLVGGATGAGFTVALTTSTVSGKLPCANFPALTGVVTTSAGSCATSFAASPTFTGVATFANGSAAAPSIVFAASSTAGFYSLDAVTVGMTSRGLQVIQFSNPLNAVNYYLAGGSATGTSPTFYVDGSDTDIGLIWSTKGVGEYRVYSGLFGTLNLGVNATRVIAYQTTVSTSKTTGAIVSSGGLGVAGAIFTDTLSVITMAADTAQTDATVCRVAATGLLYTGTGALGICLGTSGEQFKTDLAPMQAGLAELMKIDMLNYRYRPGHGDDGARMQYGPTAQGVEVALPGLVNHNALGVAINYDSGALFFIGLRAIQELKADNDNLRLEIEKLKAVK